MPNSKTVHGMYCSPLAEQSKSSKCDSCYNKNQLLRIVQSYNNKNTPSNQIKVSTNDNKNTIWNAIEDRMIKDCDNEACWIKKLNVSDIDINHVFRPERPIGKYQWLSTTDIRNVLKQYEHIYSNFVFLGPVPMDFCDLTGNEVCNIDLRALARSNVNKVGVVFNTDPSDKPGKHWVSMFIDLEIGEIGYFDSYGMAPLAPQIVHLINIVKQQYEGLYNRPISVNLNCNNDICVSKVQHQTNNSECGVYSINFIVERLTGKPWKDIVHNKIHDEQMVNRRKYYFRPAKGGYHRY